MLVNSVTFSSVPILDYSLLSTPEGHKKFVDQLRHALVDVGFLYLSNLPVARSDIDALIEYTPRLFDLPQEEKERIIMANSPHFFGYSRLGAELTKGRTDQREQFDFATPYDNQWKPGDPDYLKLWGQPQVCSLLDWNSLENICSTISIFASVAIGAISTWLQGDVSSLPRAGGAAQLRVHQPHRGSI